MRLPLLSSDLTPYALNLVSGIGLGGLGLGGYGGGLAGGLGGAFLGIPVINSGNLVYGGTGGLGLGLGSLRGLGTGLLRREDRALEDEGTQLEDNEVEKQ